MMLKLDEFLIIFIIIVVLIGVGWFVYDTSRKNDK